MSGKTLSQSLQEIVDAKSKGLLTEQEARTHRQAVIDHHASTYLPRASIPVASVPTPPLSSQDQQQAVVDGLSEVRLFIQETRRRYCCCTPRMWSKLYHAYVFMFALACVQMSILQLTHFEGSVWINCTGPDAHVLNESHPYFCDEWYQDSKRHHHGHNDDDDDSDSSKYFCGNEKFEFRFGSVEYENKYYTAVMTWTELLGAGSNKIFTQAIGQFTGNDELWIKSDHDSYVAKAISIFAITPSALGLVLTVAAIACTFLRRRNIEMGYRWTIIASIFALYFALAVACLVLISKLEPFKGPWDNSESDGTTISVYKATPWTPYYLDSYGCQATVGSVSFGFPIVGFTCALFIMLASLLRRCCVGKSYDLDVASGKLDAFASTSVVPPVYECAPLNSPPAYDGSQSIA